MQLRFNAATDDLNNIDSDTNEHTKCQKVHEATQKDINAQADQMEKVMELQTALNAQLRMLQHSSGFLSQEQPTINQGTL